MYAANAVIYCMYPLAGFLADIRIGQFITIYEATKFLVLLIILEGIIVLASYLIKKLAHASLPLQYYYITTAVIFLILFLIVIALALFNANIIQFGVDQLHDSPADHQSLVCVDQLCSSIHRDGCIYCYNYSYREFL